MAVRPGSPRSSSRATIGRDVARQFATLIDEFVVDLKRAVAEAAVVQLARAFDAEPKSPNPAARPRGGLRAIANGLDPDRIDAVLARIIAERALSEREALAICAAANGVPRSRLAEVLGVSENTIKTQVRSALRKLQRRTLDDAVWWIRGLVIASARRGESKRSR